MLMINVQINRHTADENIYLQVHLVLSWCYKIMFSILIDQHINLYYKVFHMQQQIRLELKQRYFTIQTNDTTIKPVCHCKEL